MLAGLIEPRLRLGFVSASISCEHCRSSRNNPHYAPRHIIYYYVDKKGPKFQKSTIFFYRVWIIEVHTIVTSVLFIILAIFFFKCSNVEIACQPDLSRDNFRWPYQQDLSLKKNFLYIIKTLSFVYWKFEIMK